MMLQAIALAITCFIWLASEALAERFICLVLEELALAGNPAEQSTGHQLLARAQLIRERPRRMVEIGRASGGLSIDRLVRVVTLVADCAIGKNERLERRDRV